MNETREGGALFEHRFWLQILGDHSRFILNALPSPETADIRKAEDFIRVFDRLLSQARSAAAETDLGTLGRETYRQAIALRAFKLDLLARQLQGKIAFRRSFPTI